MATRVRVGGPLESFGEGIQAALVGQGYSEGRTGQLMLLVGNLSRWMDDRELTVGELSTEVIGEFFASCRRSWCRSPRSLTPVLAYLRATGAAPPATTVRVGRTAAEIELWNSFRRWCVDQRGLKATTAEEYVRRAEACLRRCRHDGEIAVGELDATAVLAAVQAAAEVLPGPSLRCTVTALRSLLRFLHATGRTSGRLAGVVPPLKGRVRMVPPSPVSEDMARRLLASCDTTTATGRRDAAILTVLIRLGLRAQEVASLRLEDIDWRRGELSVAGKGGRADVVPIPIDVGKALAAYLRGGRPTTTSRAVFVKATAPFGPMTPDGVAAVVRLSCNRAGQPRVGPHRLRHLVATATLRAGAPLAEVAQLLRHADVTTTALYAVADPMSVATLARPWPGADL
ncbi:MAG: tyrosine-type recombinase/integrase [Actinomycetota bacterium]